MIEALKRYQQTQKEQAFSDQVVQGLAKNPSTQKYLMGDKDGTVADALDRYTKMGHNQKQGYSQGLMANMAADLQQQKAQQDAGQLKNNAQYQQAQIQELNARSGLYNKQAQDTGSLDPVVTDPLVVDGKPIPGIGTNRKTGQYVYFGQNGQGGDNGTHITFDQKTGVPGYPDNKGTWKPLKIEDIQAAQSYRDSQQKAQQPGMSMGNNPIVNYFRGGAPGQPAQAPQGAPAPPKPGEIRGNWKYKVDATNPADPNSWEPAQGGQ